MADLQARLAQLSELHAAGRLMNGDYAAAVQEEISRALAGPMSGIEVAAAARALRALVAEGLLHQAAARITAEKLLAKSKAVGLGDAGTSGAAGPLGSTVTPGPAGPVGGGSTVGAAGMDLGPVMPVGEVSIDIMGALRTAWHVVIKRFWKFFLLFLVTLAVGAVIGGLSGICAAMKWRLGVNALKVADVFFNFLMQAGITRLALILSLDPEAPFGPSILFREGPLLVRYMLVSLLIGLAMIGGLVLLVIPGVVFFLRYSMALLAALEGHTVGRAMGYSSRLTYGHKKRLLIFFLALFCLNLAGLLALGVGLLFTYPMTLVAVGTVYRQLQGRA